MSQLPTALSSFFERLKQRNDKFEHAYTLVSSTSDSEEEPTPPLSRKRAREPQKMVKVTFRQGDVEGYDYIPEDQLHE